VPKQKQPSRAPELQQQLRQILGHDQINVKPYGNHLLIQLVQDDDADTMARLSELGRGVYGAAFRSHTGRWEPLPGTGPLKEMAELVTTLIGSYLQPY
jgi:hypothetical protein